MLSSTVSTGQRHIAYFDLRSSLLLGVFQPLYVGYIYSLGSIVVPKHKPTSGSGDLSSTLGEEVCAPLWFKTSVLLAFLNFQQCNTVLVNVETLSLVSPQIDLATKPTTKVSLSPRMTECFQSVIQRQVYVSHHAGPHLQLRHQVRPWLQPWYWKTSRLWLFGEANK